MSGQAEGFELSFPGIRSTAQIPTVQTWNFASEAVMGGFPLYGTEGDQDDVLPDSKPSWKIWGSS